MWYLCHFLHRHLDFRRSDLESAAVLLGYGPLQWQEPPGGNPLSPFWRVWLPDDEAARHIMQRSMLLKSLYEVWGEGGSWEALEASIRGGLPGRDPAHLAPGASWSIRVDGFGCGIGDPVATLNRLSFVPFQGPVQLRDPDNQFRLIQVDTKRTKGMVPLPEHWFFGRQVAAAGREYLQRYLLPGRRYLGPTSMDAEMAFIMCNHALVRRGRLVYDPFVGTGGVLLAAAHHGAATLGSDIDMRVIRLGKTDKAGQQVDLWTNFRDYGLRSPVGLLRADAHTMPFREGLEEVVDAIVTDPPYGVRAGARKSVHLPYKTRVPGRDHFPHTDPYTLAECLADLLESAAQLLRLGGRLVYFLPVVPEKYDEAVVPSHPALEVLHNCEQILTDRYSRRLITMQKTRAYDQEAAAAHAQTAGAACMAAVNEMAVADTVYEHRSADPAAVANGSSVASGSTSDRGHRKHRGKHV